MRISYENIKEGYLLSIPVASAYGFDLQFTAYKQ